ncbi:MAG TPA: DUF3043 domain-containing protein [Mycobacteriales bacterium]|nr:DUF3043 domain-containing protein [Mycobacteriales bacterium]
MPFGRAKSPAPVEVADPAPGPAAGKGRATPKRSEARKARRTAGAAGSARSSGRGGSSTDARARARAERQRQREALLTGDERNLPPRDAGPEKRLARDVVDSRLTIGQIFIAIVFVEFLLSLVIQQGPAVLALDVIGLLTLAIIVADSYRHGRAAKDAVAQKYGEQRTQGIVTYAFLRAMLPRRFRRPPPKVARGGAPL